MATTVQLTFTDDEEAREFIRAATSWNGHEVCQPGCGIFYMPVGCNETEDTLEVNVVDVKVVS